MNALHRAIRTFFQDAIRTFLLIVAVGGTVEAVPEWESIWMAAGIALWAGSLAVLTWIYNFLEDKSGHSLLKD